MAYLNLDFYSKSLDMDTHACVLLPQDFTGSREPAKVIYLLHGLSDDCTKWSRLTSLERYIRGKNVAVVMPEVQRSWYSDAVYGLKYFQFIAYELPDLMTRLFNISPKREDTYIAGLSMGGYGALRCALSRPDRYCKVAAFSSVCDLRQHLDDPENPYMHQYFGLKNEFIGIYGEEAKANDDCDNRILAARALKESKYPPIFMTCGEQDTFCGANRNFKAYMDEIGYPCELHTWEGYHNWEFWDKSLPMMLEFFDIQA